MIEYPSRQPQVSSDLFSSNTFLDFVGKNRVQELSLEKLKRTNHEMNGYTKMPQNGVFHDEFIHKVLSIAERCEYQPEITGLFAAQNQERKLPGVSIISELERRYGQKAVEVHILRRLFVNIKLVKKEEQVNGKYETCLAIAYHQRGIQVGFGTHVIYCHNQMLLNAECYVTTYSDEYAYEDNVTLERLYEIIYGWLQNANKLIQNEQEVLERWQRQKINYSQLMYVMGRLMDMRVREDSSRLSKLYKSYPLGRGQIFDVSEELIHRLESSEEKKISLWDIYDAATNLYKPWLMPEFPNILSQNKAMADFLGDLERTFTTGQAELPRPAQPLSDNDIVVLRQRLKDKINRDIDNLCFEVENSNNR